MALHEFDYEKEPTVSVVKSILNDAIKMKATDVHFDPIPEELIVRFRINGELKEYTKAPESVKTNIITRVKIIAGMNITDSLLPQIGSIAFDYENKIYNMRVSSLPIVDGEKLVAHISNYNQNIKSISKMGFEESDVNKINDFIKSTEGIVLLTGNTNSGKTTTKYAILKEINSNSNNIISIENPIKTNIEGINQVQVSPEKGLTYRKILNNIVLQDPNVVAIDELIDDETARLALRIAVTGRLVISTMHTKTVYQTIDTLLNMDIENYLLGANLNGIISQRLVKKLCPKCRKKTKASEYEKHIIEALTNEKVEEIYSPTGCEECTDGYIEQIPVVEIVEITEELKNAISNNKNRDYIRSLIYDNNDSILKNAFKKVISGETSFNEVIRIMNIKTDFSDKDNEIKEYILGNKKVEETQQTPTTKEVKENKETNVTEIDEPQSIVSDHIENTDSGKEDEPSKTSDSKTEEVKKEDSIKKVEETNVETKVDNKKIKSVETSQLKEEVKNDTITPAEESKSINVTEEEKTTNDVQVVSTDSIEKQETKTETSEVPIKVEETKETENNNISEVKVNPVSTPKVEEPKTSPIPTAIPIDDDDDDDDFNYGDSYINNF